MKYISFLIIFLFMGLNIQAQYAEVSQVLQWCNGIGGAIQIEILEGDPEDYYYTWSHDGNQNLFIEDLSPGTYSFYIENRSGCSQTLEIQIIEVDLCKLGWQTKWDPKKCGFYVETVYYVNGSLYASDYVVTTWNIQNLAGSDVFIEMPEGQDEIEVCLDYMIPTVDNSRSCCNDSGCITLQRPNDGEICGFSEPCKVVINEVYSKKGNSFVELLVVGDKKYCPTKCDLTNIIIDDNNGQSINDLKPLDNFLSGNIDNGYITLKNIPNWASVPIGSMVVLYENAQSADHISDPTDADKDNVYSVWIGDEKYIQGFAHASKPGMTSYGYDGFPSLPKWDFIKVDKGYDGLQVRSFSKSIDHSLSFGQSQLQDVKGPYTVPLTYSNSKFENLSASLIGTDFNSSSEYQVSTSSTIGTPREPNSQANKKFVLDLLDCGKIPDKSLQKEESINLLSYKVSPNPTNGNSTVLIKTSTTAKGTIFISIINGEKLIEQEIKLSSGNNFWKMPQSFSRQAPGIYLIEIIIDGESAGVKKIVLTN